MPIACGVALAEEEVISRMRYLSREVLPRVTKAFNDSLPRARLDPFAELDTTQAAVTWGVGW